MHWNTETTIPADLLLVRGRCIANVVMLPVESTPLRKGSVELWGAVACLVVDGAHKNVVLFGETKVLQSSPGEHPTSARRLSVFNDIFIVLIYVIDIYIYSIIFYSFNGAVHNRKAGPAHRRRS